MQNDQTVNPSISQTPITFTGNASDYFGIWIVNLLLSIVTLGIYSAWAKVRRKKYFYQNTLIDGVGFDYHASPMAILKGRVIAFVLFVIYNLLAEANPILGGVFFLLLLLVVPSLVVRGLTFNARNTSHRGLRFDFKSRYGEVAKIFVLYPILVLFSLGLAYPWWVQRINRVLINGHRFGLSAFDCAATVGDFYRIFLKLLGIMITLSVIAALLVGGAIKPMLAMQQGSNSEHTMPSIIIGAGIMYLFVLAGIGAYVKTRISNLVWNHTQLEQVQFVSTQRMRDVMWLYATNIVALVFTLGLATPWAQIRLMRYRLQHLHLQGQTDWDSFVGEKKEQVRATGAEIADMFDVDISFA
jgi:uncharacterized membrane protein YjgN (DUF898 family)